MFIKTPEEVRRYTWDWSAPLAVQSDTISAVNWEIPETFLPAPANLIETTSTTGGTLAAAAWYYVVTAVNQAGETVPSNEVTTTTTGTVSSVELGWNQVTGATGYNVYRGSNATGTPVTFDGSGSGTVGHNSASSGTSLTATCTYTKGSSANYVVAAVGFFTGFAPSLMTCTYGPDAMTLLGWNFTGYGGIAYFGLATPPTGLQTVSANVQSLGGAYGVVVTCSSFNGWGSTVYTGTQGAEEGSPSQTVSAVYGDLVVWSAVNVTGSGISAALSAFNGTTIQNSGSISLPSADAIALLLGYTAGGSSGPSSVSFSASVAQANIDQWWSAAALTLLPAAPPINTLVTTISDPTVTQYVDTGTAGSAASPPAANTAATSITPAAGRTNTNTATTATVWVANGSVGGSYPVTCQITTAAGEIRENTQTVQVIAQ